MKKYPWLWQLDKRVKKRANLYIVNLQWTPKDEVANVKINGKCDIVMQKLMDMLGLRVPKYRKSVDPIYTHYTPLHSLEGHTTSQPLLKVEEDEKLFQPAIKLEKDVEMLEPLVKIEQDDKTQLVQNGIVSKDCNNENPADLTKQAIADNCDTSGNKCLPSVNKSQTFSHSFSIDNLLQSDPKPRKPNYFVNPALSLLSYNLFGVYTDFFLYPYQTSFLYSGLHSIINPVPIFDENDLVSRPNQDIVKIEPECGYCSVQLGSNACLFYTKFEPIFKELKYRYTKMEQKERPNVCICCDYTTDEDDLDNANVGEGNNSKSKIQAGWFGKGYRKGRRRRKGV